MPHLHLIHSPTYKQHTSLHTLRSLVLPRLTFWAFPLYSPGLPIRLWPFAACLLDPAFLVISSLSAACPDVCIVPVADSALPTWHLLLPLTLACLTLPCCSIKAAFESNATASSLQKTSPKRGFSSFSKEPWPGMDPFDQLLDLKQGSSPIEEYVTQFYKISCKVPFDEVALKDIFRFGLCEPIKSYLPEGEFHCSLKDFMDYALLCAGSSFTVGVAEEEHDRKMAATTTHHQSPESHNMPTEPESAHVMLAKPGPARIMSATPESPAKMATKPADAPLRPGLIACVLDAPLVSVRAAGMPRSAAESAPEAAPSRELAESAPEAAPSRELAESAPEAAPSQELAESAPSQELAESALQPVPPSSPSSPLVPPSSPSSPLVPPSSPSSPLVPPSLPSPLVLSSLALSERPRDPAPPECPLTFAPPECPLEVVELPRDFLGGSFPPLLTEAPNPPWPMEFPDSSWLPEAPDLLWPPRELTTSILKTKCALSVSCVSVSSRFQSLPWVSAPPWWAPVSSAPPWWAPVSSAPPWCAPVSSDPP